MTVLVTAGSKHGATREVAKEIADVLDEHGVSTELVDIDDVTDLSSNEAYGVGSGIYRATGSRTAVVSSTNHAAELAECPTWLFASGSIVGEPPLADDPNAFLGAGSSLGPALPVLAIVEGAIRELVYKEQVGESTADQISLAPLIALLALYCWALQRLWPLAARREALSIGAA